uniref:Deoxynucleotidyltransferase terminal-interacting protein 1-like n=1 Tax=Dermatophagoides pteronyssinus TaxID=6956 RepID=A0A6P6Y4G8_DERPT|nr:deoxynucleotidyltransferase terminal-interacting protein 1-like [Dermatophagoides pteronyssinus]
MDLSNTNTVTIKPFNMRYVSLENFPPNDRKCSSRVAAINRFREEYPINCPFKSINLLRQLLQTKINQEIGDILQKYRQTFLEPVFNNVRQNLRNNELANDLNINAFMHQVLDEAKKMFPLDDNDKMLVKLRQQEQDNDCDKERQPNSNHSNNQQISTASNSSGRPRGRPKLNRTVLKTKAKRKRKTFIMSSNATQNLVIANNDDMAATTNSSANSILKNANKNKLIDDNESKWDPSRLSTKTLFVLGSKANKALGFGAARGRLYSKHSNLFRYIGDHEDKEWLHKNQLMPTTGGKAYLLVRDDIIELLNSDEYRETPGVDVDEMGEGFTVPQSMIDKISTSMIRMTNISIKQSYKSAMNDQRIKVHPESMVINRSEIDTYDETGHLFDNDDNGDDDDDNFDYENDDEQDKDFTID